MAVRLNLRITSEHRGLLSIDIYIYIYIYTTQLAKYPRVLYAKPSNKVYIFNIQYSFTVKNPRVRLVEIDYMTTLSVSIPHSLSAVIKSHNALQLLQLSIHSKTVQIFIQVLVMNSLPLIYYFLIQEWLRNSFPSENLDDLSAEILAEFIVNSG